MNVSEPLETNYGELANIVDLHEVDAYVHVGEGTDDVMRYLTRVDGEDKYYAFAHTGETTAVFVQQRYLSEAYGAFPGDEIVETAPEQSVVEAVAEFLGEDPTVRVPETVPVGIVRDLESVAAVEVVDEPDTVWCVKNEDEIQILADIAKGVQYGIARAETVLARAEINGNRLLWEGRELTTERLRREVQKALADYGLSDFGNIIVGAGPSCADLHFTGLDTVRPHETVLLDLSPRGPAGYYGDISRTFVPGEPDEWALEAYDIVEEALRAAFDTLERGAGVTAGELYGSMADVIESHGYETGVDETADDAVGLSHGTGHGIGVRIHEKPFQWADSDVTLEAGNVFTVEPGLYDPSRGGVRLEDVVVLKEDGFENFMDYPTRITPVERGSPPEFI